MTVEPEPRRYWLRGTLTVRTPLHIGCGSQIPDWRPDVTDEADRFVAAAVKDHRGLPYIPASAVKGVLGAALRAEAAAMADPEEQVRARETVATLLGEPADESDGGSGGLALFDDAILDIHSLDPEVVGSVPHGDRARGLGIWTGVRIDRQTGTAKAGVLYAREVVPPGARFDITLTIPWTTDRSLAQSLAASLQTFNRRCSTGRLTRLGAKTGSDFGAVDWSLSEVRSATAKQLLAAAGRMARQKSRRLVDFADHDRETTKQCLNVATGGSHTNGELVVTLDLDFHGPLAVLDPSQAKPKGKKGDKPDFAPIAWPHDDAAVATADPQQPAAEPPTGILPPTSFRGAFRSQAERICRTVGLAETDVELLIDPLFGNQAQRSTLRVTTQTTDSGKGKRRQEFVAIDRFTGGVSGGKKFDGEAWDCPTVKVTMALEEERLGKLAAGRSMNGQAQASGDAARGLLLLALRDVAEGDVTFGYGASKGYGACTATISLQGGKIGGEITYDTMAWTPTESTPTLKLWVDAFRAFVRAAAVGPPETEPRPEQREGATP